MRHVQVDEYKEVGTEGKCRLAAALLYTSQVEEPAEVPQCPKQTPDASDAEAVKAATAAAYNQVGAM